MSGGNAEKPPLLQELIEKILTHFLSSGEGVQAVHNTANSPYVNGQDFLALKNVNRIVPAFTVFCTTGTIKVGWQNAVVPLPPNTPYTLRWKNPSAKGGFVLNDGGTAQTIYVIS